MRLVHPYLLLLLLVPLLLVLLYLWRELSGKRPHMRVSSVIPWMTGRSKLYSALRHIPFALAIAAMCLLVVALARPRSETELVTTEAEGIDIVFAMDISSSMLARDFNPDRISAAKSIAVEFISKRMSDRMGIVLFAGESYTQCPMTTDRTALVDLMSEIQVGIIDDGTAIGNGLATAINCLQGSDAPSKVVILLTDGVSNMGEISPETSAEICKDKGIRVYTIGVGSNGTAPYPVITPWGQEYRQMPVEIDEAILKKIASSTGGEYYRATDNTKLSFIFDEIDRMEKTRLLMTDRSIRYDEKFPLLGLSAMILLLIACLAKLIFFRSTP